MTIALSNALAATQTALLASQFHGGFLRIFGGDRPATPDRAETGTLLGVVSVDGLAGAGLHFIASGSALVKADEPWVFQALAAGTARWFRLVAPGDTGANDLAALRVDGSIGLAADGADMSWAETALLDGVAYTIDSFIYSIVPVS